MPYPDPPRISLEEAERRADDAHDERADLERTVDRAAEHASLPFFHPAVQRLARRERARRTGLDQEDPA